MGKKKNNIPKVKAPVAEGLDPFCGAVALYKDGTGYWIENSRTGHVSDYLKDDKGKVMKTEPAALQCFEQEKANTQFSQPIHP